MSVEDDALLRESSLSHASAAANGPANRAERRAAAGSRRVRPARAPAGSGHRTRRTGRHRHRKSVDRGRARRAQRGIFRRRGRRRRPRAFLAELPGIVIVALLISVLIKAFLVQAFYIPSGSMERTLLVNDRVLVNKMADKPHEIERGDIVVFQDPGGWLGGLGAPQKNRIADLFRSAVEFVCIGCATRAGDDDLIKRVIGVGGDRVRCCDTAGRITVNGVALDEPYIFPGDEPSATPFDVKVPPGRLWVMGDHRAGSLDSRAHHREDGTSGFVPVDDVVGRAFSIVWPVDRLRMLRAPATLRQERLEGARR